MRTRRWLVAVCVLAVATAAAAQQPAPTAIPSGPLSLEQVLDLAAARSEGIGIAEAGIRRALGDETRARSGLFPQLSLSAGYDRALASEFSGIFNSADAGGSDGSGTGTTDLSKLPFGRANTWRISLAFSQNLYSGGRIGLQRQLASQGAKPRSRG